MRNEFTETIEEIGKKDQRIFFLTGDLGFNALENLQTLLKDRFINAGVAEQNMVGVAAGMAYMGLQSWAYSIAPFITLKVVEQVRNDICRPALNVKLVGNGGGYGYGIRGATHHALEDIAIFLSLPNIKVYAPAFSEDVSVIVRKMNRESTPSYLRLGLADKTSLRLPAYSPLRRILKGSRVVVIALGPLIHNALRAVAALGRQRVVDLWSVTELPVKISKRLFDSIDRCKRLVIVEEHVRAGGLGEKILYELIEKSMAPQKMIHLYARGYPSGRYGSQAFHQKENELDSTGILKNIKKIL